MRPYLIYFFLFLVYSSCEFIPQKERISTLVQEPSLGSIHFEKGDEYRYSQQYGKAIKTYRRVLDTQRDLRPIDSAYGCIQIAYLYLITYQEHLAKPWLELSEHLMNRTPTVPTTMKAAHRFNLSRYHYLSFSIQDARALAHESRVLYDSLGYGKHLRMAQIYDLLSLIHIEDGILTDSASYYAKLAQGLYHSDPSLVPFSAESDFALATVSYMYRAHERGEYHCRNAMAKLIGSPTKNPLLEARCWSLLGNLLKKQGDAMDRLHGKEAVFLRDSLYKQADSQCFAKAIQLGKQYPNYRSQQFFRDRIILASRYEKTDRFFDYLGQLTEHLRNTQDLLGHPDRLLGYMYFRRNPDSALFYYERFLSKTEQSHTYVELHLKDEAHYILRELYLEKKELGKALTHVTDRLEAYGCCPPETDYFSFAKNKPLFSTSKTFCLLKYADIANILLSRYEEKNNLSDLVLANNYFQLVAENYYSSILHADEDALLSYQLEAGKQLFTKSFEASFLTYQETLSPHWLDLAFQYIEQTKSNALVRSMKQPLNIEEENWVLSDSIRVFQNRVNQLRFQYEQFEYKGESKLLQDWQKAQIKLDNWNAKFRKNYSKWQSYQGENYLAKIKTVQRTLGRKEAIIQFLDGSNTLYGIYVDSKTIYPFEVINKPQVDSLLKIYKNCLAERNYSTSIKKSYFYAAYNLYERLVAPYSKFLRDKKHLIVIPDGILNQIPFEAFLVKPNNIIPDDFSSLPYLVSTYSLSYSPSWKLYSRNRKQLFKTENFNSIGVWVDPSIESYLVDSLKKGGISPDVFNASYFGKNHFLREQPNYKIIHLTTHAKSDGLNRLNNKIYFGAKASEELFGFELASTDFQADLLVLAACETALGPNLTGEGTFSLTRSFLQVGIPRVVSTLWEVKQEATDKIIIQFYNNLMNNYSPVASLAEAKRHYIQSAEGRAKFPGYWAGITITH